ncbi:MAG: hypothetical protein GX934_11755 [Burkholderiales bacterium]|nr:hypothetical protein [Burkholderiales bacterium]
MQPQAPECPVCGGVLRLETTITPIGPVREWLCTDSTCPTIIPESALQGERGDLLGAPVEDLMRAPVTPQGATSGNGRARRRQPKPGDREAMQARRERRYLDQAPAGRRDREPVEKRRSYCLRLSSDIDTWLAQASERSGMPRQGIIEALLWAAMEAPWCTVCDLPGLPGGGCIGGCRSDPD